MIEIFQGVLTGCENFLHALESAKISQMMIFSCVVKVLCEYFVVTCQESTVNNRINQQDFNIARARTITSFQMSPYRCFFQIKQMIFGVVGSISLKSEKSWLITVQLIFSEFEP